jgi:hypothetical protein
MRRSKKKGYFCICIHRKHPFPIQSKLSLKGTFLPSYRRLYPNKQPCRGVDGLQDTYHVAFTSQPKRRKRRRGQQEHKQQVKSIEQCRRRSIVSAEEISTSTVPPSDPSKLKIQESNCSPVPCQKKKEKRKKKRACAQKAIQMKGKKERNICHLLILAAFFFNPSPQVKKKSSNRFVIIPHTRAARKKQFCRIKTDLGKFRGCKCVESVPEGRLSQGAILCRRG